MKDDNFFKLNFFEIFNIPQEYNLDKKALENKLNDLQKQYHLDSSNSLEQKFLIEMRSSRVNIAYQTLNSDLKRAIYLMNLWYKIDIEDESTLFYDKKIIQEILDIQSNLYDIKFEFKGSSNFKNNQTSNSQNPNFEDAFEANYRFTQEIDKIKSKIYTLETKISQSLVKNISSNQIISELKSDIIRLKFLEDAINKFK